MNNLSDDLISEDGPTTIPKKITRDQSRANPSEIRIGLVLPSRPRKFLLARLAAETGFCDWWPHVTVAAAVRKVGTICKRLVGFEDARVRV